MKLHILYSIALINLIFSACKEIEPSKTGMEGKPLPTFSLLMADSTTWVNTNSIKSRKASVFFLFGPHCPFSKAQMTEIVDNIKELSDIEFYVITPFPFDQLKEFYGNFKLDKYSNIHVGRDTSDFFGKYYGVQGVPFTAIYNQENKLQRAYLGKVDHKIIEAIARN